MDLVRNEQVNVMASKCKKINKKIKFVTIIFVAISDYKQKLVMK